MSALSPLVRYDQDPLRCLADIYRQLRDEGVRYAPEIDAYVVPRHDDRWDGVVAMSSTATVPTFPPTGREATPPFG